MQSELCIPIDGAVIDAYLEAPPAPRAMVTVANTVGASEAAVDVRPLLARKFAVLVVDLLAGIEHDDARHRLDVFLLARRLAAATDAARRRDGLRDLSVGYLGIGTAAAAALVASLDDHHVGAIVCRGRPDLAEGILGRVTAPTLLVADTTARALNTSALASLRCAKRLLLAPRTSPPSTACAATWFLRHLGGAGVPSRSTTDTGAGQVRRRHPLVGGVPHSDLSPRPNDRGADLVA
jgi:putative phosphoribosyl transferase